LPPHPLLRLGPGDDAAVLRMAGVDECVVTVDLLTDHVDFELAQVDPRRVGRKALAANLSDLAAMASKPLAGVIALALPRQGGMELALALYEGMLPLAERYDLAIAGGDTNSWEGPLAISITLLGSVTGRGPLCRSGARPGDRIVVTGSFGGSILGRHLDFEPRVREALELHARYELHAGIDVSDGLSLDLAHILGESHCGAVINADAIPIAADAGRLAEKLADGSTPLEHALGDGEDFELVLAVPPEAARKMLSEQPLAVPLSDIGEFVAGPGLWIEESGGSRRPLTPRGWEH
jgi:thiamine-monophosphate kinase